MGNVLQEVAEFEKVTRDHVVRRVDDWVARIDALFLEIDGWLPPGLSTRRQRTVSMHEEMMRKFDVPLRELPVLEILRGDKVVAQLEPRGLWIIGANGRVDLVGETVHYLITDNADGFAPADWRIAPLATRSQREKLDRNSLLAALS